MTTGSPLLPWPRCDEDGTPLGVDLAARGPHGDPMAEEVRRLALKRLEDDARPLVRRLVDPDELVQEVYRLILRRNRRPCAYDPRRASLGTYCYRVAGNALSNLLEPARLHRRQELHGDQERLAELPAEERDADLAIDAQRAVQEPLWQRALRRRQGERDLRSRAAAWLRRPRQYELLTVWCALSTPVAYQRVEGRGLSAIGRRAPRSADPRQGSLW